MTTRSLKITNGADWAKSRRFEQVYRNGRSGATLPVASGPQSGNRLGLTRRPGQMSSTRDDDRQSVEGLVIALPLD
jgi:hypothetical protein